jgi:putative lipoic acid-binding regulatory protein
MKSDNSSDEFYKKLRKRLKKTSDWPAAYLYKFIVPSSDQKNLDQLIAIFDNLGAVISTKKSSKGKYTSVSINVTLNSPDIVIEKYKQVGEEIENVISL